jgi:hypothetical protein
MLAIRNRNDIDIQQVLRNIGYGNNCQPPARIESLIDDYVENVYHLIEPSYSCVIRDIMLVQGASVVIDGSIIFESEVVARLLERCGKVAVFLVTIGNRLEEMVHLLAKDRLMLQATVLDAIGSDVVEKAVDFVQGRIGQAANFDGFGISRRFSPGYCDWDVSQQKMVFQAVDGESAGVHLTEGCLMLPRKSISGIIGIGPANSVENYNPCRTCYKQDCPGRR